MSIQRAHKALVKLPKAEQIQFCEDMIEYWQNIEKEEKSELKKKEKADGAPVHADGNK